ncbi:M91 family zinc metallopeptidase [Pseudomonas sp. B22129]|uniref:M91 family zinc metallopeptidase n=1 Tax=Pseudomonas sp. B22129 TaxID=3235111 RepID=UPI003783F23A
MRSTPSNQAPFIAPPQPPAANNPLTPPVAAPIIHREKQKLVDDGTLSASRLLIRENSNPGGPKLLEEVFTLETGDTSDVIHISQRPDGQLHVQVNGRDYAFDTSKGHPTLQHFLYIKTNGGDDRITIAPNVTFKVEIRAGDGDDTVQAGSGETRVYGGRGNDQIRLGSGTGYAEGNEGDDTIMGGTGHAVMYGNGGHDRLYAGSGPSTKHNHLDGGTGDDQLYAGNGYSVLNGGPGNDLLVGHDHTAFYTGEGRNTVWANSIKARIYAQATDRLIGAQNSSVTYVKPSEAGRQAFSIEGPADFIQRVEDDLALLRASPQGQKMLEALDKAALQNGGPVNIVPSNGHGDSYDFWSTALQKLEDAHQLVYVPDAPRDGYIKDGVAGARADKATIFYDPADIHEDGDVLLPLLLLYHEMAHAWNGANGTFLPGSSDPTQDHPERPGPPNAELQAVGLATNAPPFDFDNDPSTPPTSTNPAPFSENSLNQEMGKPLRQRYA